MNKLPKATYFPLYTGVHMYKAQKLAQEGQKQEKIPHPNSKMTSSYFYIACQNNGPIVKALAWRSLLHRNVSVEYR